MHNMMNINHLFAVSAARATGPDISQFYIFYMVIYFNIYIYI